MSWATIAAVRPSSPGCVRVHFAEAPATPRIAGRRDRWAGLWAGVLRAARTVAQGILDARRHEAERKYAVLAGIDEADLSEAGRRARREALHAMRDAQRRAKIDR